MKFYARAGSWQFVKQLTSDLFMVVWAAAWWVTGRFVDGVIRGVAGPVRQLAGTAEGVSKNLSDAGDAAGKVPLAGGDLRKPLDGASHQVSTLVAQLHDQVAQIERTATVTGWLVFLIPLLVLLSLWLPARLRFRSKAVAAQRFMNSPDDLDLFALRAMATLPMDQIAKVTATPVADWRAGNREVTDRLAELALEKEGLRRPRRRALPRA